MLTKKTASIEIEWTAATSNEANNGTFKLCVDENSKATVTTLNNDSYVVDSVRLGVVGRLKKLYTIRGSFKLDAFDSDMLYYIGP